MLIDHSADRSGGLVAHSRDATAIKIAGGGLRAGSSSAPLLYVQDGVIVLREGEVSPAGCNSKPS